MCVCVGGGGGGRGGLVAITAFPMQCILPILQCGLACVVLCTQ